MTTPASNVNIQPITPCQVVDPWGGILRVSQYGHLTLRVRPSSGTSPLRTDGTRAPRAWSHRWGHIVIPVSTAKWQVWDSWWGWLNMQSSATQSWSNTAEAWLNTAQAGWVVDGWGQYFPATPRSAARTKLLNKLQDGKANWGQTMGEARQTINGIADVCDQMLRLVERLSRYYRMEKRAVARVLSGKRVTARDVPNYKGDLGKAIREIPSAWLGLQFGLKPLFSDIDESAKALQWLLDESPREPVMVIRAGHSDVEHRTAKMGAGFSPSWESHTQLRVESNCHLSCTYAIAASRERTYNQLGVSNSFSVMYELLPWSWACDYVTDTGDWLNALFARDGTSFIEGSETLVMKVTSGTEQIHPGSVRLVSPPKAGTDAVLGRMERSVLTSSPGPWFPTFRNRIGLNQMANLTAALSQLVR